MLKIIFTDNVVDLKIVIHYIEKDNETKIFEYQVHNNDKLNPIIARFKTEEQARNFIENYSGELPGLSGLQKEN